MKTHLIVTLSIVLALATLSGCGFGPPDPLLYAEDGSVRTSVGAQELEDANVPSCDDYGDLLESEELIQVPVGDEEGGPVLIGVGGMALCLNDSEGDGQAGDLEIKEEVGPDEDHAVDLNGETGEEEGVGGGGYTQTPTGLHGDPVGTGGGSSPKPLVYDPTPEPATN